MVQRAIAILIFATIIFSQAWAKPPQGLVVVERPQDYSQSYKQRRTTHGMLLSVGAEQFFPSSYYSLFKDAGIGDIIGEKRILLFSGEIGYKFNFFASGGTNGKAANQPRNLSFVRQGLSANFALDNITEEPILVPYVQGGAHQYLVTESGITGDLSDSAPVAFNYRIGGMLQLDWVESFMDPTAKLQRLKSSKVENVFLDVYYSEYLAASSALDPANPTAIAPSSGEFGVGLKVEF
jgi:hypothetical protein